MYEYKVWNMHDDWQPLEANDLEEAWEELDRILGPYGEEARIRDEDGEIHERPEKGEMVLHFQRCKPILSALAP